MRDNAPTPKGHDSPASSTQDSVKASGSPGKPYRSGANVHKGNVPKPPPQTKLSGPKTDGY